MRQPKGQVFAAICRVRRGTGFGFNRYAFKPIFRSGGGSRRKMIFGKKERAIHRVLVVEDEPLVAFDNEHLLQDAGYEVAGTVDTVEDARRVMEEEEEVDLVLLDINLSDGSGIEVARIAQARGINVLFVTGNCPAEHQALAVGCLSKPYSDRVLKNAIEAIDALALGNEVKKIPEQLTIFERDPA
jgi:two-component system, response regulator PdtaR